MFAKAEHTRVQLSGVKGVLEFIICFGPFSDWLGLAVLIVKMAAYSGFHTGLCERKTKKIWPIKLTYFWQELET